MCVLDEPQIAQSQLSVESGLDGRPEAAVSSSVRKSNFLTSHNWLVCIPIVNEMSYARNSVGCIDTTLCFRVQ